MINDISLKLKQGQYLELEEMIKEMNVSKIQDILINIAYETGNINIYAFIVYMFRKSNGIEWLKLAIDIMNGPLCFIEGAYSIALFHTRELLNIDRNVANLEKILFFYNIPEKLIDSSEAYCIAEEILNIESDNEIALQIK